MGARYEIRVAKGYSRRELDGELTPWEPTSFSHLVLDPEGTAALGRALVPFNQTPESFLTLDSLTRSRAQLPDPVAIVLLPRDYHLAGHFIALRGERSDVKFSYCSYQAGDPPLVYPPLSIVHLPDWEVFASLAERSPLLAGAWETLAEADRDMSWLCLADPLPEPWAEQTEREDRTLFEARE